MRPDDDDDGDVDDDDAEEEVPVGSVEPGPLGGPFGSGASPMSRSSKAVLCLAGWWGMLWIS